MGTKEQIFNYIVLYKMNHDGLAPMMRDICDAVNVSTTSVVAYHLDALEAEGRIRRIRFRPGGIEIIGGQWSYEGGGDGQNGN